MKIAVLRRRKLGATSCRAIRDNSNHDITLFRNDNIPTEKYDLLIRWGTNSQFDSKKTLNKVEPMKQVNNKIQARQIMLENGINVPETNGTNFPMIIRPIFHSQGRHLYFVENQVQKLAAEKKIKNALINTASNGNSYSSHFIDKDEEWGVFIFQGRVWSMIKKVPKTNKSSIAWNVAQGTHSFENVNWSEWNSNVAIEALKAFKCFDLDFGRVDVIVKDGVPYILEINSAHSLTSPYRQETFAKCIDYYIDNGPIQNELDFSKKLTYKSFIHPILRANKKGTNL